MVWQIFFVSLLSIPAAGDWAVLLGPAFRGRPSGGAGHQHQRAGRQRQPRGGEDEAGGRDLQHRTAAVTRRQRLQSQLDR